MAVALLRSWQKNVIYRSRATEEFLKISAETPKSIRSEREPSRRQTIAMTTSQQKPTVLIVDDEPDILELLGAHVASLGMKSLKAINGQEALEILEKNTVDLVISDLVMPKKSGMSLLQVMNRQGMDVPFVFITGYATKESMVQALKLGAFDYLEKPFEAAAVKAIVKEAVRVGQERRALKSSEAAVDQALVDDPTRKIINLRSLRDGGEGLKPVEGDVKALFVNESLSQLKYCLRAIEDLKIEEQRTWETGYLFRVMQSIKQAAQAVGASDVERLASAAESCFSMLRLKPGAYNVSRQDFLSKVAMTLKGAIEAFGKGATKYVTVESVLPELAEYCTELSGAVGLEEAI